MNFNSLVINSGNYMIIFVRIKNPFLSVKWISRSYERAKVDTDLFFYPETYVNIVTSNVFTNELAKHYSKS